MIDRITIVQYTSFKLFLTCFWDIGLSSRLLGSALIGDYAKQTAKGEHHYKVRDAQE